MQPFTSAIVVVYYTKHLINVGPIHSPLRAAARLLSTTTTTTRDRGDRYGPIEWAQWTRYSEVNNLARFRNGRIAILPLLLCWRVVKKFRIRPTRFERASVVYVSQGIGDVKQAYYRSYRSTGNTGLLQIEQAKHIARRASTSDGLNYGELRKLARLKWPCEVSE